MIFVSYAMNVLLDCYSADVLTLYTCYASDLWSHVSLYTADV